MVRDKILIETKLCYISGTIVLAHTFYTANQPMWQTNYTVWSVRHFFNPISKRYGVLSPIECDESLTTAAVLLKTWSSHYDSFGPRDQ